LNHSIRAAALDHAGFLPSPKVHPANPQHPSFWLPGFYFTYFIFIVEIQSHSLSFAILAQPGAGAAR
jgi:hypothetical protein